MHICYICSIESAQIKSFYSLQIREHTAHIYYIGSIETTNIQRG